MTFCRKHTFAPVSASLSVLLAAGSFAQDLGWRERAAREAQRVAEARRAELIRRQYERRRSATHARFLVPLSVRKALCMIRFNKSGSQFAHSWPLDR